MPPYLSGYPQDMHRETGVIHRICTGRAQSYAQGLKRPETAPERRELPARVYLAGVGKWVPGRVGWAQGEVVARPVLCSLLEFDLACKPKSFGEDGSLLRAHRCALPRLAVTDAVRLELGLKAIVSIYAHDVPDKRQVDLGVLPAVTGRVAVAAVHDRVAEFVQDDPTHARPPRHIDASGVATRGSASAAVTNGDRAPLEFRERLLDATEFADVSDEPLDVLDLWQVNRRAFKGFALGGVEFAALAVAAAHLTPHTSCPRPLVASRLSRSRLTLKVSTAAY